MPSVAAFAISAASAIKATAVVAGKAMVTYAPAIGAGVGVFGLAEQSKARKAAAGAAASAAERAVAIRQEELEFAEKQAGEYYQITSKQMELQAQAAQIDTLANVLTRTRQPAAPRIVTLPAAKTYSPIESINRAIGNLLRAG